MQRVSNSKGFTLIELLIVIVIIGILAGVLIAVIDPTRQQNRAKDANVQATMNKAALSASGHFSAYGSVPDGDDFILGISGATAYTGSCADAGTSCVFTFGAGSNLTLNTTGCGTTVATAHQKTGAAGQCYYRYEQNGANAFYIYAPSFGLPGVFRFNSSNGKIEICNATGGSCA